MSALFYFGNCDRFSVRDATFAHAGGFAVQCGDGDGRLFENVTFDDCYADGLHLNGNLTDVLPAPGASERWRLPRRPAPRDENNLICVSGNSAQNMGGVYVTRDAGASWQWFGEGLSAVLS